jgi:hypothetical protein
MLRYGWVYDIKLDCGHGLSIRTPSPRHHLSDQEQKLFCRICNVYRSPVGNGEMFLLEIPGYYVTMSETWQGFKIEVSRRYQQIVLPGFEDFFWKEHKYVNTDS